jgi:S1-C subfamily serine protease
MITTNVIHRVFRVRYGTAEGTAFSIDVDDREYLVTAKHVVSSISESDLLDVFSNGRWINMRVSLVGHAQAETDISVLARDRRLTPPGLPLEPSRDGLTYGQDVYFLGFPYGFVGSYVLGENGYPLPFVKRATLSLFDGLTLFLDGQNNPGFSGGPVIFSKPFQNRFSVAGVISAFRAVTEPVYRDRNKTDLTYTYNTGIIVAHSIDSVLPIARAHPIGALVRTDND